MEDVIYLHRTLCEHVLNHMKGSIENDGCILLLHVRFEDVCYNQTCLWTLKKKIVIFSIMKMVYLYLVICLLVVHCRGYGSC